jgi:3-hydroxyisobutyrate dehydrogenase-like beta-hydroxyacid dehydrogenase
MTETTIEGRSGDPRPKLAFLGLGGMGSRMAGRLLAAGYDLAVFNRTPERAAPLAQRGARLAETPAAAAAGADVVFSSLADDHALESVMFGPCGALAGARARTVFVEMSTVSTAVIERLHGEAAPAGVDVLDAPVSGSTPLAEQGQLTIFVGGDSGVYERTAPLLAVLGAHVFHMGPAGSGIATKYCVNALLGLGVQALAEAIVLAERMGLSRQRFLQVAGETAVISPSQRSKLGNAASDSYPSTFPARLMAKDLRLILEHALERSVPMPSTAAAAQMFAAEHAWQAAHRTDEDFSSVIRTMRRLAEPPGLQNAPPRS